MQLPLRQSYLYLKNWLFLRLKIKHKLQDYSTADETLVYVYVLLLLFFNNPRFFHYFSWRFLLLELKRCHLIYVRKSSQGTKPCHGQSNKTQHLLYILSQLLTNSLQDIKSSPSEFIKCCSSIVSLIVQLDYGRLLPKVI